MPCYNWYLSRSISESHVNCQPSRINSLRLSPDGGTVIPDVAVASGLNPSQDGTKHGTTVSKEAGQKPPHLRLDPRTGIWSYRRVIPERLRAALGGRTSIRRSLGVTTHRFSSREFKEAYSRARTEVEAELRAAEAPTVALTQRDTFGLMRELLLAYEMADSTQTSQRRDELAIRPIGATPTTQQLLAQLFSEAKAAAPSEPTVEEAVGSLVKALSKVIEKSLPINERIRTLERSEQKLDQQLLEQSLSRLNLQLNSQQKEAVLSEFQGHKDQLLRTRTKELEELNFNSVGGILEQLPAPPEKITTWQTLRQAWIDRRGGIMMQDGSGLSEESIQRADKHWEEIRRLTGVMNPTDVTTEMMRKWIKWQRERKLVEGTIKSNLAIMKAIFKVGLQEGLLTDDVSQTLGVTATSVEGYRPFSYAQVIEILKATEDAAIDYQYWLPRLGLYTGARIEELAQLRGFDIKEVEGVQCLHLVHSPTDELPTKLKGKRLNERLVPIHPWLLSLGIVEFAEQRKSTRLFQGNGTGAKGTIGPSASRWFRILTQKLGIWEERKLVFHSFRGTFKDLCRRHGVPAEKHDALTGHSSGTVGEKSYGETLRMMPAVTAVEIRKLPSPEQLSKSTGD